MHLTPSRKSLSYSQGTTLIIEVPSQAAYQQPRPLKTCSASIDPGDVSQPLLPSFCTTPFR